MGRERYLGMVVLSDKRHIRATYSLDGNGLPYRKAKRRAKAMLRELLGRRKGMCGALYDVAAFTDESSVQFSSDEELADPNTRSHEEVHMRASARSLRENWQMILPLEESIAYAYGDYVALNAGRNYTMPRDLRERHFLGKHSMRLLQCIEYEDHKTGTFGGSLRILYRSAEQENKNLAWALDVAANYLFYRECLGILEQHGTEDGLAILFGALKVAGEKGLDKAWLHVMRMLKPQARADIVSEAKLPGRPLVVRSPYSEDCDTDDFLLG